MNQPTPRKAPAGPTTEERTNENPPSELDAMPSRKEDDAPKSNESVESGKR